MPTLILRAPADGVRLSYCADCEVIKGRAIARGFTVAQMVDAFERGALPRVFGADYHYILAGTRFDPSSAHWAPPPAATAPPPHAARPPVHPTGGDADASVRVKRAADGEAEMLGAGKRRKKEQNWASLDAEEEVEEEFIEEDKVAPGDVAAGGHPMQTMSAEELAASKKRCALCKCASPAFAHMLSRLRLVQAGCCSSLAACVFRQNRCIRKSSVPSYMNLVCLD